jgi:hypothetical protein
MTRRRSTRQRLDTIEEMTERKGEEGKSETHPMNQKELLRHSPRSRPVIEAL